MVSGFSTALGFPPVCAQSGGRIQDQHPLHGHRGSRGFRGSMSMVLCLVSHAGALELGCSQPFLQLSPISCFFFFSPAQQPALAALPPSPLFSPVALPRVPHVCVVDAVLICLLVQEIEHVLDGQRERAAAVHGAEQRLKQVVHKLLQRTLKGAAASKVKEGWRHTCVLCTAPWSTATDPGSRRNKQGQELCKHCPCCRGTGGCSYPGLCFLSPSSRKQFLCFQNHTRVSHSDENTVK